MALAAEEDGAQGKLVSPHFKLILLAVLAITLACLAIDLALSILYSHPDSSIQGMITSTDSVWKGGAGGLLGLVGGRAA